MMELIERNDNVEIIRSNKGGLKLIHRGYMYTVHKKRQAGGIRWRCTQRGLHCKGSISTDGIGMPKVNMPHNHVPDPHSVALARCRQLEEVADGVASTESLQEEIKDMPRSKTVFHLINKCFKRMRVARFKNDRYFCVFCKAHYALNVTKMSQHLITCEYCPYDIKYKVKLSSTSDLIRRTADSMPVQERLNLTEPPALSPIKPAPPSLKQINPPAANNKAPTTPNNNNVDDKDPDEVCLRWNSHHSNMKTTFPSLLEKEQYVDCTVCSEGKSIKCHRLILSSCSSYFEEILATITPLQHPVIFLKGIPFWILKALIDFMYVGEVHIEQTKLQEILEVAEALKVKGLTGKAPAPKEPKKELKQEPKPPPPDEPPLTLPAILKSQKFVPPLRVSVTKEQAAALQTVDPLSLLKPSFYEENVPSPPPPLNHPKRSPIPIRPKLQQQSLAEFTAKQKDWLSKKIPPKKKLKRKSTEHEPSPPPVILRKGTKSRPIVKAPKYYHMEYEDDKHVKTEEPEEPLQQEELDPDDLPPPALEISEISIPQLEAFDISNVKCEPLDIEETNVNIEDTNMSIDDTNVNIEDAHMNSDQTNVNYDEDQSTEARQEKDPPINENNKHAVTDDLLVPEVQMDVAEEPGGKEDI